MTHISPLNFHAFHRPTRHTQRPIQVHIQPKAAPMRMNSRDISRSVRWSPSNKSRRTSTTKLDLCQLRASQDMRRKLSSCRAMKIDRWPSRERRSACRWHTALSGRAAEKRRRHSWRRWKEIAKHFRVQRSSLSVRREIPGRCPICRARHRHFSHQLPALHRFVALELSTHRSLPTSDRATGFHALDDHRQLCKVNDQFVMRLFWLWIFNAY